MEWIGMEMGGTFSRIEKRGGLPFLIYMYLNPFHCTFPIGYEDIYM